MNIVRKYKESFIGIGAGIFTAIVYYNTGFIENRGLTGRLYSATIPQWICYAMWALSLILIITDIWKVRKGKAPGSMEDTKANINWLTFVLTFIAISVYILLMRPVGFCPSSAAFLFALTCILSEPKERNYVLFAIISVVVSISIYYIFRYGLNLMLPRGIMPF